MEKVRNCQQDGGRGRGAPPASFPSPAIAALGDLFQERAPKWKTDSPADKTSVGFSAAFSFCSSGAAFDFSDSKINRTNVSNTRTATIMLSFRPLDFSNVFISKAVPEIL
jgi:hypothetical protein